MTHQHGAAPASRFSYLSTCLPVEKPTAIAILQVDLGTCGQALLESVHAPNLRLYLVRESSLSYASNPAGVSLSTRAASLRDL